MKRLTYDFELGGNHCWQVEGADNLECREVCERQGDNGCKTCPIAKAFDRLADIENILGDEYELEVLKTIWENYKRGKCVLAPFIQGQLVWLAMDYGLEADEVVENYGVSKLSGGCISGKDVGKIAFSTKAEAEAALRREQDG